MSTKESAKVFLTKLLTVTLAICVFLILFPLLLEVYVIFCIYRFMISKLSKIFRPDLVKILEPHSGTYAATKAETNVVLCLKLEGKILDLEKWKWTFLQKVILATHPDTGALLYPEFQQYVVIWGGYPFWKPDEQFSIHNHVHVKSYENQGDLNSIETELLRSNCQEMRSPWELVVCQHSQSQESGDFTVFFKFHHSLADGYSIFNALMHWADTPPEVPPKQMIKTTHWRKILLQKCIKSIQFPFKAAYDIAKISVEQYNAGTLWEEFTRQSKSELRTYLKSKPLDTEKLKRVSVASKVQLSAVLVATIVTALRKFMQKTGRKIPEYVMCPTPLPLVTKNTGANRGLQNSFTIGMLNVPFSTEDPSELLRLCNINLMTTKTSTYGQIASYALQLVGNFPTCFLQIQPAMMEPLFFSNFAGPRNLISLDGLPVLDLSFSANFSKCNPMVFTLLSYNGKIRLVLNVDSNLFPNEGVVAELLGIIEAEFDALGNL